ncbi:tripartite tricarboxylate transporter substrate binding protein [Plastoroseomonas arctica]|uniref:Tripartite tricarboxylate transporter substrate binding protein n=1 Tax=Plastoroseomonas arctica TaxID=1509237 RepID=A0AAF1K0G9_9PROT|nr:tripartite tricarboxylate transporter substrate binding protein [Plastoroseomonas arctica]MBR0653975.1 tripartite tricarboxylate transporter substrate binding protein [Plastoroseomonas arctica]
MNHTVSRRALLGALPLAALASRAGAQAAAQAGVLAGAARTEWAPDRAVRIIIPVAPGGSLDILGRTIARALSPALGQPVVAENHAGAGSNLAFELTARARPDGLTLLVGSDPLTINPGLYPRVGYDPVRDFAPIIEMVRAPQVLVVNPASPVRDLAGFVAAARGAEGAMTVASQGNGSIGHLAGALFARERGIAFTHVPYRGGGPAVLDVVAGHVDALFVTLPAAIEHIRGGRLRALAVTSAEPSPALPDVPSIENLDVVTWQGLLAPAGTPGPIIARIAEETGRALRDPALRETLTSQGFAVTGTGPEAFAAHIRSEAERWPTLVRAVGARVE